MDVHPHAGILAVGSSQQFIGVLSQNGNLLGTIKYHEGFMGHRIGPVSCMAFHPYKVRNESLNCMGEKLTRHEFITEGLNFCGITVQAQSGNQVT